MSNTISGLIFSQRAGWALQKKSDDHSQRMGKLGNVIIAVVRLS